MANTSKRSQKKIITPINFEEIDHRLSCGWHVEVEESGQRKRYLKQFKTSSKLNTDDKISA